MRRMKTTWIRESTTPKSSREEASRTTRGMPLIILLWSLVPRLQTWANALTNDSFSAVEQAKDEQISDMIRDKYKSTTGSDMPVSDKSTALDKSKD